MTGIHMIVVKLLYGSGLNIIEYLRLRMHHLDQEIGLFHLIFRIDSYLSASQLHIDFMPIFQIYICQI